MLWEQAHGATSPPISVTANTEIGEMVAREKIDTRIIQNNFFMIIPFCAQSAIVLIGEQKHIGMELFRGAYGKLSDA